MKLNKKLEIGMSAVRALKSRTNPTGVEDLLSEVSTTRHLLEQVMRNLRMAGIVSVKRGPGGGYTLDSTDVTAYHVAQAVGRDMAVLRFDESPTSRLQKSIIDAYINTKI